MRKYINGGTTALSLVYMVEEDLFLLGYMFTSLSSRVF